MAGWPSALSGTEVAINKIANNKIRRTKTTNFVFIGYLSFIMDS
jgi:hypothetical protein